MPLQKILSLVSPMACAACLAVGYAMAGQWVALVAVLIAFLAWLAARQRRSTWLSLAALVISISLAAAGLFAGVSPTLMILSATLALASWDLVLLDHTLAGNSSAQMVTLLEKKHYPSLVLALGLGLLAAVTGRMIRVQIPLGGMILLAILVLFGRVKDLGPRVGRGLVAASAIALTGFGGYQLWVCIKTLIKAG